MVKWFKDSYKIVICLETHQGKQRFETYRGMSLSDYEVLYGTITDKIISVDMRLENDIGGMENGQN
jgi:hypothetical protein